MIGFDHHECFTITLPVEFETAVMNGLSEKLRSIYEHAHPHTHTYTQTSEHRPHAHTQTAEVMRKC